MQRSDSERPDLHPKDPIRIGRAQLVPPVREEVWPLGGQQNHGPAAAPESEGHNAAGGLVKPLEIIDRQ